MSGLVLIYTQIVTSPEGGEGHLDRDTVTDMCVDLARCLDTLEEDLVILLRTTTSTTCIHMSPFSPWKVRGKLVRTGDDRL